VERTSTQDRASEAGEARTAYSDEPSSRRDDHLLFVLSLVGLVFATVFLVVAAVLAALWVQVEVDFAFVWLMLGTLALGAILLVLSILR